MSSMNLIKIECAGSGKTWSICHTALSIVSSYVDKRVAIISYTNRGVQAVQSEIKKQNNGIMHSRITVESLYSFLLRELIKPYQSYIFGINEIISLDFSRMYGFINKHRIGQKARYMTSGRNITANEAAELVVQLNTRSRDYKELLDTLALDRFSNTEISTLKFFNDFPELMSKYDIRDHYELHNLLKKICNKENYSNISFEKQPYINFGTFDFDKELDLLVRMLSPVSQKELIDYIYLEYGFEKNTTASKLSVISKYCHNGVYNVDYKKMPENRLQIMKNNLNEPFYYFDEVKDKYSLLFVNADRDEINPYTLKKMGFHVLSKYILSEKYESLREYFIDLLTKNDVIKISDFTRRYTNVQMYYQTLSELKKSYKIIQADADTYISFRKLEEKGIALDDIHEFCNKVYATVNDGEYFTIHSIRSYGFTDIFENAGFGEYLCSALLACDSRFDSQSIFLSIVLSKNNEIGQISKKSFIKSCLSENVPCSPKKLIESVYNKYGVRITDKYEITEAIKNSNFCYDDIIDEIYAIE